MQMQWTPLHFAARFGHSEPVQLLLAAKGNASAEDKVRLPLQMLCMGLWVLSYVAVEEDPATIAQPLQLCGAVEIVQREPGGIVVSWTLILHSPLIPLVVVVRVCHSFKIAHFIPLDLVP